MYRLQVKSVRGTWTTTRTYKTKRAANLKLAKMVFAVTDLEWRVSTEPDWSEVLRARFLEVLNKQEQQNG